jgi:hypothetical protein
MTLFIVGFIVGGVVIGTLVAAIMLSMGAQTDRERRAYDDLHGWMQSEAVCVRALEDENTASETPEGEGGGSEEEK